MEGYKVDAWLAPGSSSSTSGSLAVQQRTFAVHFKMNTDIVVRAKGMNISFLPERKIKLFVVNAYLRQEPPSMPTIIQHRKINIVTLQPGESVADQCGPGDIALVPDGGGWWTNFVGENGEVDSYDMPFESYNEALWAAKAAAEFSADGE